MQEVSAKTGAMALCSGDLQEAQRQLVEARNQIDDLKKSAAAKDEPKGQN